MLFVSSLEKKTACMDEECIVFVADLAQIANLNEPNLVFFLQHTMADEFNFPLTIHSNFVDSPYHSHGRYGLVNFSRRRQRTHILTLEWILLVALMQLR